MGILSCGGDVAVAESLQYDFGISGCPITVDDELIFSVEDKLQRIELDSSISKKEWQKCIEYHDTCFECLIKEETGQTSLYLVCEERSRKEPKCVMCSTLVEGYMGQRWSGAKSHSGYYAKMRSGSCGYSDYKPMTPTQRAFAKLFFGAICVAMPLIGIFVLMFWGSMRISQNKEWSYNLKAFVIFGYCIGLFIAFYLLLIMVANNLPSQHHFGY
ncbi:MAG: hypothetical protein EHM79_14925 [Geobacter sp.]|nr:MAG: hypothetical protein EHM79_14925 [Geobacter sp.]